MYAHARLPRWTNGTLTFSNLICECLLSVFKVLKLYSVTDDTSICQQGTKLKLRNKGKYNWMQGWMQWIVFEHKLMSFNNGRLSKTSQ